MLKVKMMMIMGCGAAISALKWKMDFPYRAKKFKTSLSELGALLLFFSFFDWNRRLCMELDWWVIYHNIYYIYYIHIYYICHKRWLIHRWQVSIWRYVQTLNIWHLVRNSSEQFRLHLEIFIQRWVITEDNVQTQ